LVYTDGQWCLECACSLLYVVLNSEYCKPT
jgi:hypothetical protein